jgi:hypothetical protein
MYIIQDENEFTPVKVVLETQEEVDTLYNVVGDHLPSEEATSDEITFIDKLFDALGDYIS